MDDGVAIFCSTDGKSMSLMKLPLVEAQISPGVGECWIPDFCLSPLVALLEKMPADNIMLRFSKNFLEITPQNTPADWILDTPLPAGVGYDYRLYQALDSQITGHVLIGSDALETALEALSGLTTPFDPGVYVRFYDGHLQLAVRSNQGHALLQIPVGVGADKPASDTYRINPFYLKQAIKLLTKHDSNPGEPMSLALGKIFILSGRPLNRRIYIASMALQDDPFNQSTQAQEELALWTPTSAA